MAYGLNGFCKIQYICRWLASAPSLRRFDGAKTVTILQFQWRFDRLSVPGAVPVPAFRSVPELVEGLIASAMTDILIDLL